MNGLMECIRENDPFYRDPISDKKNGIYVHMQPAIKRLIVLGEYPVCAYVGQTDPLRQRNRFKDGDYSKCAEKVIPDILLEVHHELSDYYVRENLYGSGCNKTDLGGSPEIVSAPLWIKTYSEFVSFLRSKIINLSENWKIITTIRLLLKRLKKRVLMQFVPPNCTWSIY